MPVVDASVVVDWVAPDIDPESSAVRLLGRLREQKARLSAPPLLFQEVGNVLLTGVRGGRWSGAAADESFVLLRSLPVVLVNETADVARAWELSRRFDQHPIYDMVYVALAERTGSVLYTADARLRRRVAQLPFVLGPDDGRDV